ncbi:MAG: hypothetical protein PHY30_03630 [Candidatus Pacebacteria bacterium]|nr:hypothetical protein [Candidatus Paceibacterota bacterium]
MESECFIMSIDPEVCQSCEKIFNVREDIKELKENDKTLSQEIKEIKDSLNAVKTENAEIRVYYKLINEKIDYLLSEFKILKEQRDIEQLTGWQTVGGIAKDTTKAVIQIALGGGILALILKGVGVF